MYKKKGKSTSTYNKTAGRKKKLFILNIYSQKLFSDAAAGRILDGDGEFFRAGPGCGVYVNTNDVK